MGAKSPNAIRILTAMPDHLELYGCRHNILGHFTLPAKCFN